MGFSCNRYIRRSQFSYKNFYRCRCCVLHGSARHIKTPALIIMGKNDAIVPPVNGQFLADRLPNNRNLVLDAEHRVWEEAASEYIETVTSWFSGDYHTLEKKS